MVIDKLENLEKYVSLNPLFAEAVAFLKASDLQAHEVGKVVLKEMKKRAWKHTMTSSTSRFQCRGLK